LAKQTAKVAPQHFLRNKEIERFFRFVYLGGSSTNGAGRRIIIVSLNDLLAVSSSDSKEAGFSIKMVSNDWWENGG